MRMTLTVFALVAAVSPCAAQGVSAADARAEKSPLIALAEKVNEVTLVGETAEKDRAVLSSRVEKVSGAVRGGDLCGALKGLAVFKFYVSRFSHLGRLKSEKDERDLLSLANRAARRIEERAERLRFDCPARDQE
jgi:hypothetical protein